MAREWRPLLVKAQRQLAEAGVPSPQADAELLASHVAEVPRGQLMLADAPDEDERRAFLSLVEERSGRTPLQHLLGVAPFRYLELAVGPGVFIPRPETELLVEWALQALQEVPEPVVMDLCAGSGAIGLSIKNERPDATVYLVEKCRQSVMWLQRNLSGETAYIVEGDATSSTILAKNQGACDAVLSNPPYVPAGVAVSPEVASDPATAVFAGQDGLDVIRGLIPRAVELLRPGGVVAIEHDDTHHDVVPELMGEAGLQDCTDHRDLAGRPRFATARTLR